jgi:hypothetical protein
MPTNSQRLRRKIGGRQPRVKEILVTYDGERTEAEYFLGWRRELGNKGVVFVQMLVTSGGNARKAGEETIKITKKEPSFDAKWCVCDADDTSFQDLEKAYRLANKNDIKLCLSVRSFEVWLALHWECISLAHITNEAQAVALVQRHHASYCKDNKLVNFSVLFPLTEAACKNADWLLEQGLTNPKTTVHELIKELHQIFNAR